MGWLPEAYCATSARIKFDRVRSRPTITTSAPRSASIMAVANPMPLVAPVIRTVFPLIDISLCGTALNISRAAHCKVHTLELRPSSVYRKLCSRRKGCINRQESHGLGNFFRLAKTLHRNACLHLKVDLIVCLLRHSYLVKYGR